MEQYEAHEGLVHSTARAGYRRALTLGASLEFDDVLQEARIAFLNANDGYKPETGFAFSTYYTYCAWSQFRKMFKRDGLVAEKVKEDDVEAQAYGLKTKYVRRVSIVSADALMERATEDGEGSLYDLREDESSPSPEATLEMRQQLAYLTAKLSPQAKAILSAWVTPGEQLKAELQRVAAHSAMVAGQEPERVVQPSLAEVCQVLVALGGSPNVIDKARREVLSLASGI
jgi:DNA-directed RNA polymerase sigma subunit (sigma70/sigma32)